MNRRTFVGTLPIVLLVGAPVLWAQSARVYRVGLLAQDAPRPGSKPGPFATKLQELGYVEGRNLVVDRRWAEGSNERFPTLADELVALKPDVIVADSTPATIAAKRATTTIPIVMVSVSDPVGTGIVVSLAQPGGNVTGITDFGLDVAKKYVGVLHELVPNASRIAVLMSNNPVHPLQLKVIQEAAQSIGLTLLPTMITTDADLEEAYASMARQKAGALIWLGGAPVSVPAQFKKLIALSARSKMPTLYPSRRLVQEGGLVSYGPRPDQRYVAAAVYVDKILKGAKPADLPVEQPKELELVINLKTASALGLTIPKSLQVLAEVIQ